MNLEFGRENRTGEYMQGREDRREQQMNAEKGR